MGVTAIALIVLPLRLAGQWYVATNKDAMTDEVSWRISTFSVDGSSDSPTSLNWECDNEGVVVYLRLGDYLSGDDVQGQYRFDSKPASPIQDWELSDKIVILPQAVIAEFTAQAKTAAKVLIRVTGSREMLTYTFDLDGWSHAPPTCNPAPCPRSLNRMLGRAQSDSLTFVAAFGKLPCGMLPAREQRVGDGFERVDGQVFLEAVVEERPDHLFGPALRYPELLKQAGVQGRVLIQAVIDTTGRAVPSSVKILQSAHAGFDGPARNYVLQSLFRPGRVGGRAVKVLVTVPVDFTLKK